jgi:glyoxylase-like metal-dependent hydrolase (beta-lactamase superfamily II)/rhodanese-related sulfurtransferase
MVFEQFYLGCLSHASYLLGSYGVAAVVDPQRDVRLYLEAAHERGLEIDYIIETHLHADFVSGHRELAALTGAQIYMGARADPRFSHVAVVDEDEISFGHCRLRFLETPGHSLDSISIVVTDLDRSPEPFAVLTGDTLFIGDVGRPDLSKGKNAREMAGLLYRSLHEKLLKLPNFVEVYPAHGAGSLCGKQLSSESRSTIGREKATNYALRAASEADFIELITSDLPERPGYFALDKEINRSGARPLSELPPLRALRPGDVLGEQENGAVLLDTRPAVQFAASHLPGSVQIGLAGEFAVWAGDLLGLKTRLVLIAENQDRLIESRIRLARVGIESVAGYLEDGLAGWVREGMPLEQTHQISAEELARRLTSTPGSIEVLDVRRPSEWAEGFIEGAVLVPLHDLTARLPELDRNRSWAVHCKGGYRSAIAASLLQRSGFHQVFNIVGGFDAWRACDLPYKRAQRAAG